MNKIFRNLILECAACSIAIVALLSGRTPQSFLRNPGILPWFSAAKNVKPSVPAIVGSQGLIQTVHAQTCGS